MVTRIDQAHVLDYLLPDPMEVRPTRGITGQNGGFWARNVGTPGRLHTNFGESEEFMIRQITMPEASWGSNN